MRLMVVTVIERLELFLSFLLTCFLTLGVYPS